MIKNYIKIAWRNLWKNKVYSFINVFGLTIGITACWIVFKIVSYELAFDKKLPDVDRIYQIVSLDTFDGETSGFGGIPLGMAPAIAVEMPDPGVMVPIYTQYIERIIIPQEGEAPKQLEEERDIVGTSNNYFKLLPYQWIAGNPKTALNAPNTMILTEDRAKQYFPKSPLTELIGKTIKADTTLFTISGIVKELPYPSSFTAKTFIPIPDKQWSSNNWVSKNSDHTLFVKTQEEESLDRLLAFVNKKHEELAAETYADMGGEGHFEALPLLEKHFSSEYATGGPVADKKVIYGLIAIGGFILLLACINYINLSTAQVPQRAKEIGIRKTLGGRPLAITVNFLVEILIITLLASLLSWPLTGLFQMAYPEFFPGGIENFGNATAVFGFLMLLTLIITLILSVYPAFLINKVQTAEALKGKSNGLLTGGKLSLRKSLIVFQFVIAQFFVVSTLIIGKQLSYTLNKDLGFEHNAVVNVYMPYKSYQGADIDPFLYKQALKKHPEIEGVAMGHMPLSNNHWGDLYHIASDTGKVELSAPRKYIDKDYLNLYKIELLAGTNLVRRDTMREVLINDAARKALGFQSPEAAIGQWLTNYGNISYPIVGVVKDFHQKNLRVKIEPLILGTTSKRSSLRIFNVKLPSDRSQWNQALVVMEQEWKTIYPNAPFEYKFNDERIKSLYQSERRTSKLIGLSSFITIFISCLGLFGLVTLTTFLRTKEIGVRKVLGSTVTDIVALLSKDFIKLVMIAIIIASPMAWWAMNRWLENFAYRIDIPWWIFALAGLLAVAIALVTISSQAIRSAMANPIKSLRTE
ncbi:ABC transporter permease [Galbibacter sp. EGI 63066]|uniref:ABC transporter permease n=1 Tax=Galbibacter sp. EGI 63066 TaxID=2993559 RepID=UPI0022488043|nr:ABC transporter permease [Galbibacter sp. EGI 63066]MCX2681744.1 ABC transporter permease [Galbibacter sp. EGI 63066]